VANLGAEFSDCFDFVNLSDRFTEGAILARSHLALEFLSMVRTFPSLLIAVCLATVAQAENRVTLEILAEGRVSGNSMQEWSRLLRDAGADTVRIRSGRVGENASIQEVRFGSGKSYQVKAVLTSSSQLNLPDGTKINRGSISKLRDWIHRLKVGGEEEIKREPGAYGLTHGEKEDLLKLLAKPVPGETQGMRLADFLGRVREGTGLSFDASSGVIAQARTATVRDELKDISYGTAMAMALRPYNLVMVPNRELGGAMRLQIVSSRQTKQPWPVGWETGESPAKLSPVLFQFIEVEIKRTPLDKALAAIAPRVRTPMYFDHLTIEQQKIEIDQVDVKFPKTKTFYKKILDNLLFQALLTLELRIDESGLPFLWITSARR